MGKENPAIAARPLPTGCRFQHGRRRGCRRGSGGQAAGVPTSAATDSLPAVVVSCAGAEEPLVFSLEAWLADSIFRPDRDVVPEMEWMSQALLMVDAVHAGKLVEITGFGRPAVQRRVKSVLLSLASSHREQRARAEKMEQREEFLKAQAPGPQVPQRPVA